MSIVSSLRKALSNVSFSLFPEPHKLPERDRKPPVTAEQLTEEIWATVGKHLYEAMGIIKKERDVSEPR